MDAAVVANIIAIVAIVITMIGGFAKIVSKLTSMEHKIEANTQATQEVKADLKEHDGGCATFRKEVRDEMRRLGDRTTRLEAKE